MGITGELKARVHLVGTEKLYSRSFNIYRYQFLAHLIRRMQMCYCYQKLEFSTSGADRERIPSILSLSLAYTDHMGADSGGNLGGDREQILSQSEAQNRQGIRSQSAPKSPLDPLQFVM